MATRECCANFALISGGIFYFLSGVPALVVGAMFYIIFDEYGDIVDFTVAQLPAVFMMAVAFIMFNAAAIAYFTYMRRTKYFYALFFCCAFLAIITAVITILFTEYYRNRVDTIYDYGLVQAVDWYNMTLYKDEVNSLQENFHCCGVHNASDWLISTTWSGDHKDTVPTSCCKYNSTCSGKIDEDIIYIQGCLEPLSNEFRKYTNMILVTGIITSTLECIGIMVTCFLSCRVVHSQPYQSLGETCGGLQV